MTAPARFDGRLVFVTGGGRGLGAATCTLLAEEGATVAVCDRAGDRAEQVAADIETRGGRAFAVALDVGDADAAERALREAASRHGGLFALVNNAGVDYTLPVEELSIAQWDAVMATNLRGPFVLSRCAAALMKAQGGGHIVNIASTAATRAWGNAAAYHASKWGLVGFSRGLGVEGRDHGIKVTTVIPGGMRTHWFDSFPEQGIPMPDETHLQDPRNVAEVILFAVRMPAQSSMQEVIVTPVTETSWP